MVVAEGFDIVIHFVIASDASCAGIGTRYREGTDVGKPQLPDSPSAAKAGGCLFSVLHSFTVYTVIQFSFFFLTAVEGNIKGENECCYLTDNILLNNQYIIIY